MLFAVSSLLPRIIDYLPTSLSLFRYHCSMSMGDHVLDRGNEDEPHTLNHVSSVRHLV